MNMIQQCPDIHLVQNITTGHSIVMKKTKEFQNLFVFQILTLHANHRQNRPVTIFRAKQKQSEPLTVLRECLLCSKYYYFPMLIIIS